MTRDDVLIRLKAIEPEARRFGVAALYLFGSHARDEAGASSDMDVFVDPADREFLSFENYMGTYALIQSSVPEHPIGYATRDGLSKYLRTRIEREAIRVF